MVRIPTLVVLVLIMEGALAAQTLQEAARAGDTARIQTLLKSGADVNAVDANHRTALHEAAQNGRIEALGLLMAHGANPHVQDSKQREPLALAMAFSDREVSAAMVTLLRASQSSRVPRENEPWTLHNAATRGDLSVAGMLIKLGADVNAVGSNGNRPLNLACMKGNAAFVRLLIAHDVNVKARGSDGVTALHDAALGGNPEVALALLDAGAEIDARDNEMAATPLYYAVALGKAEVARMLIAHGASVTVTTKAGKTILQAATDNHLDDIVASVAASIHK